MKFFKVISIKYFVLGLDPDHKWTIVAHPSRNSGWVFARSPQLADGTYQQALESLTRQGYDLSRFQQVPQRPGGATTAPR